MKKFFKIFIWILVAAVLVGTFVYLYKSSQEKPVRYETVTPKRTDIKKTTVLTGKIEPRDEIEIKPQISGIISEVNIEAGQTIRQGDIIAKIKVIPEASALSSAQSRIESAQISLEDAKSKYEREKVLYEKHLVSREEFETAQTTYNQAKKELDAAQDAFLIVREGVSKYNASESNTLVRSTIDGLVLDVPIKVGSSVIQANTFNDGTTIATVADMNSLIFKGKVDETDIGMISLGMPMDITIGALPDVNPTAVIEYISPKSKDESGANTFEIKAALQIPQGVQMRSGYSANGTLVLKAVNDVLAVPESVLEFRNDSTFVYVLTSKEGDQKQEFERIPIVTGFSDGLDIEVVDGLKEGAILRGKQIREKSNDMEVSVSV